MRVGGGGGEGRGRIDCGISFCAPCTSLCFSHFPLSPPAVSEHRFAPEAAEEVVRTRARARARARARTMPEKEEEARGPGSGPVAEMVADLFFRRPAVVVEDMTIEQKLESWGLGVEEEEEGGEQQQDDVERTAASPPPPPPPPRPFVPSPKWCDGCVFACPDCGFRFFKAKKLRKHWKREHREEEEAEAGGRGGGGRGGPPPSPSRCIVKKRRMRCAACGTKVLRCGVKTLDEVVINF